jgi:hypothetical protein
MIDAEKIRTHSALVVLCCFLLAGCASSSAPASAQNRGIHHNEAGDYFAFYPFPLTKTTVAAKEALRRLGMDYDAETIRTPSQIVINGMSTNHYNVKVSLEAINPDLTKATIHVDYYGEKTLSFRFQHLLAEHLKGPWQSPSTPDSIR